MLLIMMYKTTPLAIVPYHGRTDYCGRDLITEEQIESLDMYISWDVQLFSQTQLWKVLKSHVCNVSFGEFFLPKGFGELIYDDVIDVNPALLANRARKDRKKI